MNENDSFVNWLKTLWELDDVVILEDKPAVGVILKRCIVEVGGEIVEIVVKGLGNWGQDE